jgi:hypothetical protein
VGSKIHIFDYPKTENVVVLATGESINDITPELYEHIKENYDILAINNFFYHPFIVPNMLHLELKHYDAQNALKRLREKWRLGWKNVNFIFPKSRSSFLIRYIPNGATCAVYNFKIRGDHPKINPNVIIDANFNPDTGIYKSYDSSVTSIINILYLMGYKNIIINGMTMTNSKYFWTNMEPELRGEVVHLYNKAHEHDDPNKPHNASHIKDYIIDFNKRHMLPNNREIYITSEDTALYPDLKIWEFDI